MSMKVSARMRRYVAMANCCIVRTLPTKAATERFDDDADANESYHMDY